MGGKGRAAFAHWGDSAQAVGKKAQWPLRCNAGIQLAHRPRSRIARVDEDSATESERFDAVEAILDPVPRWQGNAQAAGKSLTVENHVDPSLEFLAQGSPILLGEVISNLVDNALRYGGSQVDLLLHHHDDNLIVQVRDNGPALDTHTREHLLLPFWRGAHGMPEGSGLGLSIAQGITERMGGSFALIDKPGFGACFEITLPCEVLRLQLRDDGGLV